MISHSFQYKIQNASAGPLHAVNTQEIIYTVTEVVGTVAAAAAFMEVIGKIIRTIRGLYDRWTDIDSACSNLVAQLTFLRRALEIISEWVSSDLINTSQHHELAIDLSNAIACGTPQFQAMDRRLSELDWNFDHTLDFRSRLRVFFEDKASKDFQIFVERQNSALTLLLTAYNWYASPWLLDPTRYVPNYQLYSTASHFQNESIRLKSMSIARN